MVILTTDWKYNANFSKACKINAFIFSRLDLVGYHFTSSFTLFTGCAIRRRQFWSLTCRHDTVIKSFILFYKYIMNSHQPLKINLNETLKKILVFLTSLIWIRSQHFFIKYPLNICLIPLLNIKLKIKN